MRGARLFAALVALGCGGCALTNKSASNTFRYFTPEGAPSHESPHASPAGPSLDLRLGKVDAASYIKDRIAYRASAYEVGFYDELRWTEKPESYVRRALVRSLFDEHGLHQIVSGAGFVLDVELEAFEELRAPRHAALVRVTWVLHDAQRVVLQRTLTLEHPLTSGTAEAIAEALADALRDAIAATVTEVVRELTTHAAVADAPGAAAP